MRGEVPEGWSTARLGEVTEVLLSNVDKKSVEGESDVLLCNYMDVYRNPTITKSIAFMEATAPPAQIAKFSLRAGDVMITKDSEDPTDIAVPSCVMEDFESPVLCGYHLALLRPRHIHGPFLAWALRSWGVNNQFVRRANGATRFGITSGVISSTVLPLPPLPEQRKIAAILSSVDEAIAATEAVIAQTRRVKEGLLQDLLTRGIGRGGRPHTRFKQTEIGEIPESWEVRRLGEEADVRSGIAKNSKRELTDPVSIPYLRVANVQDGYLDLEEIKSITIERRDVARYALKPGDVLMNEGGDIDKLGRGDVWQGQITPCVHQNHVFSVRCGRRLLPRYLSFLAESSLGKSYFLRTGKQTTNLASINKTQLRNFPLPLPGLDEQEAIVTRINAVRGEVDASVAQCTQLRQLKQGLLQDLLTGTVRVSV